MSSCLLPHLATTPTATTGYGKQPIEEVKQIWFLEM